MESAPSLSFLIDKTGKSLTVELIPLPLNHVPFILPHSNSPIIPIDEFEVTTMINNLIGFKIDAKNPMLGEILGVSSENIGPS